MKELEGLEGAEWADGIERPQGLSHGDCVGASQVGAVGV